MDKPYYQLCERRSKSIFPHQTINRGKFVGVSCKAWIKAQNTKIDVKRINDIKETINIQ